MSPRLLVLSAGFGEGHNAAARGLVAAANERFGGGCAEMVDIFDLARPRANAVVRRGYLGLINRAPKVWSSVYRWLDRTPGAAQWLSASLRRETHVLAGLLRERRPDVLLSTYPVYAFMRERLAASRRPGEPLAPLYNVVTDSISINSLWWRTPCAGWFVPNEDSAEVLWRNGVDRALVHVCGFPVDPCFHDGRDRWSAPDFNANARPRILYIINSGTSGAAETARRLLAEHSWDVTCTVGRNETLRNELTRLAAKRPRPAPVLGWTREIPRLLMSHHVVISKAGGATTQEAIAARCPMIVNQIVPGQEEGNYELLRRHGIGALALRPDAVIAELRRAFDGDALVWRQWRRAVGQLARPNAAREIVASLFPERLRKPLAPADSAFAATPET